MKYMKVIVPLLVVVALVIMALPASAQGPIFVQTTDQGKKPVWVVKAGTTEDPFGGLPLSTSSGLGAASKFGIGGPGVFAIQGGKPSTNSGDGTSPRKSIYIGGAWTSVQSDQQELPTCTTLKVPAGTSRWFKMDTWYGKKLQVWLDDELNTATAPSGSAVFGAADNWFSGLTPGSAWAKNSFGDSPEANPNLFEGFVLAILDSDNMKPNYAYAPPNAALYTVGTSASGSPLRSGQGVSPVPDRISLTGIIYSGMPTSNTSGYGTWNKAQPSHLIWWEGAGDGWYHARVYNQMIWDGVATVCSYRAYNRDVARPGGAR
jgi:hypothetical protein